MERRARGGFSARHDAPEKQVRGLLPLVRVSRGYKLADDECASRVVTLQTLRGGDATLREI